MVKRRDIFQGALHHTALTQHAVVKSEDKLFVNPILFSSLLIFHTPKNVFDVISRKNSTNKHPQQ
jgi:hypothetical protein